MAISAVPFALQNGSHPAALFRQAVSSLIPSTGGLGESGSLPVTQTGIASMAVVVGPGRAWVPGTSLANLTGLTYSSQGMYFALNDANVTLTIAAADPTNPRIDIVCLTVNDSFYSGSTNNAVLQVITGTPAASPSAPATPGNSLVLGRVSVAANATSVTNANITTSATPMGIRHAEYTQATATNANTSGYGYSPHVFAPTTDATTQNNTFSQQDPAAGNATDGNGTYQIGQIKILEAGVYAVQAVYTPSSDPGNLNIGLSAGGLPMVGNYERNGGKYGDLSSSCGNPGIYLAAGSNIAFYAASSNAVTWTVRLFLTKLQG